MVYICMECFTEYDECYRMIFEGSIQSQFQENMPCVLKDCDGEVVELDEFIAPAIINLNTKGYRTKYCCAGHIFGSRKPKDFYVFFEEYVEFHEGDLSKLPASFILEENNNGLIIRYRPKKKAETAFEKIEMVAKCNKEFYKWTTLLPEAPEY